VPKETHLRRRLQEPRGRSAEPFVQRRLTKRSLEINYLKVPKMCETCLPEHRSGTSRPVIAPFMLAKSTLGPLLKSLFRQVQGNLPKRYLPRTQVH
jgi:hypothetical protein